MKKEKSPPNWNPKPKTLLKKINTKNSNREKKKTHTDREREREREREAPTLFFWNKTQMALSDSLSLQTTKPSSPLTLQIPLYPLSLSQNPKG